MTHPLGPLQRELAAVRTEITAVEEQRRELHEQETVLASRERRLREQERDLLAAIAGTVPPDPPPPITAPPMDPRLFAVLPRTEAVLRVVGESDLPLGIQAIVDELERRGREGDSYPLVAATLQMLLRSGRVARITRGRYAAA